MQPRDPLVDDPLHPGGGADRSDPRVVRQPQVGGFAELLRRPHRDPGRNERQIRMPELHTGRHRRRTHLDHTPQMHRVAPSGGTPRRQHAQSLRERRDQQVVAARAVEPVQSGSVHVTGLRLCGTGHQRLGQRDDPRPQARDRRRAHR
jgi:hypothetical protein